MNKILVATLLLAVTGCGPGGLKTSEVDGLGGVHAAEWIEWSRERQGEDEVWHEFVLSSHGRLCKDLQEMTPAVADAYGDFLKKMEAAPDESAQCNALENFYEDAAEITEPMFKRPLTTLSLTLRDPRDDREDPPAEDSYDQGVHPDDPWFVGSLTILEANPYLELADAVGNCGPGLEDELEDAVRDNTEWYLVDRGDVELLERGDEAYRLELDGDLEDDDGDDAGEIQSRAGYRHCVVEWEGWFEPYPWGEKP